MGMQVTKDIVPSFEIVEDKSLRSISSWFEPVNKVGCIAVLLGGVRLIDNMLFN